MHSSLVVQAEPFLPGALHLPSSPHSRPCPQTPSPRALAQGSPAAGRGLQVPARTGGLVFRSMPSQNSAAGHSSKSAGLQAAPEATLGAHLYLAPVASADTNSQLSGEAQNFCAVMSHESPSLPAKTSEMALQVPGVFLVLSAPMHRLPDTQGGAPCSQAAPSAAGLTHFFVSLSSQISPVPQASSSAQSAPWASRGAHWPGHAPALQ